jgi:hypothetical protein
MADRPRQTLTDYVTIALSPALIMALVGSLVFFLVEVAYAGAYGSEMRWMLFFFVFGMVLIARISLMGEIAGRAGIYAFVLGVLVWFGLLKYVTYPANSPVGALRGLVNLGLIILAWWCVNRLVRDCTQIDDRTQIDSRGLLQAAGLEDLDVRAEERRKHVPEAASRERERPEEEEQPGGWWARWKRYREERANRRTPGVTVVWFSLAALPLFGLGQSLIPAEAADRRRYVFWLMTVYLAAGLGLLLTTSFLGLRRYLNQRKLRMPPAMTAVWLSLGGGLVAVLLLVGALLPRPLAEYPLFEFSPVGSEKSDASRFAQRGEDPGEGEGRAGDGKNDKAEDNATGGKGKDGADKGKAAGKGKDGGGKDKSGEKGGEKGQKGADKGGKDKGSKGKDGDQGKNGNDSDKSDDGESAESQSLTQSLSEMWKSMAPVLKWIVFGLIALIVLVLVLRSGLKWLANFFEWARKLLDALRNLFSGLFGGWGGAADEKEEAAEERVVPPRPFASFSNPFTDGTARGRSPRELVRYTFAAFEAWARDRGLGRAADETPLEFARRVGDEVPELEDDARHLANLFAQAAYSAEELPVAASSGLRQTWEHLIDLAVRTGSASPALHG